MGNRPLFPYGIGVIGVAVTLDVPGVKVDVTVGVKVDVHVAVGVAVDVGARAGVDVGAAGVGVKVVVRKRSE